MQFIRTVELQFRSGIGIRFFEALEHFFYFFRRHLSGLKGNNGSEANMMPLFRQSGWRPRISGQKRFRVYGGILLFLPWRVPVPCGGFPILYSLLVKRISVQVACLHSGGSACFFHLPDVFAASRNAHGLRLHVRYPKLRKMVSLLTCFSVLYNRAGIS